MDSSGLASFKYLRLGLIEILVAGGALGGSCRHGLNHGPAQSAVPALSISPLSANDVSLLFPPPTRAEDFGKLIAVRDLTTQNAQDPAKRDPVWPDTVFQQFLAIANGPSSLGPWRTDARNHGRPAVIFNTTLVETGERFIFPTVDIERSSGRRSFHDVEGYKSLDLSAITAARLSATFTYVTPVSRALCCPPRQHRYHVADGGYYDNYGEG
jgi:hypothetical protein